MSILETGKDPLHIDPSIYKVEHPRESYYLNKNLLDRQNAWENIEELINFHKRKLDLFDEIDNGLWDNNLPKAAQKLQEIEFNMQEAWKFGKNAEFHEWYLIPKCTCPVMDNMELRGTKYNIFSGDCPVHTIKE